MHDSASPSRLGVLRLRSGFRLLALASLTPAKRLKFDPHSAHHSLQTPSFINYKVCFRLYKTSLQKQISSVFTKSEQLYNCQPGSKIWDFGAKNRVFVLEFGYGSVCLLAKIPGLGWGAI